MSDTVQERYKSTETNNIRGTDQRAGGGSKAGGWQAGALRRGGRVGALVLPPSGLAAHLRTACGEAQAGTSLAARWRRPAAAVRRRRSPAVMDTPSLRGSSAAPDAVRRRPSSAAAGGARPRDVAVSSTAGPAGWAGKGGGTSHCACGCRAGGRGGGMLVWALGCSTIQDDAQQLRPSSPHPTSNNAPRCRRQRHGRLS